VESTTAPFTTAVGVCAHNVAPAKQVVTNEETAIRGRVMMR
jgi:hypothetical protein